MNEKTVLENWKDILGYEGLYQISDIGRVRSLERTRLVKCRHGGEMLRHDKGRIIQPADNGNGYMYVTVNRDGIGKNLYIHRAVAEAFCDKPDGCDTVNHKDHDKRNNVAENLEWCTQKDNVRYSADRMRKEKSKCKKTNTGEKYISIHKRRSGFRYRVQIERLRVCKEFRELEDAVRYRDEVMNGV